MQSDAGRPLFNAVFDFVNYHLFGEPAQLSNVDVVDFEVHEKTNFALWVTAAIDPRSGRLSLRVSGDSAVLTATQAREYAISLVRVLTAIVRFPEQAIESAADELTTHDVVQLVAERAAETPDPSPS